VFEGLDCLLSNEVKDTLLLLFRISDEDFIVAVYVSLVDVLKDFLSISESELSSMSVTFGISKMLSVLVKVAVAFLPDDDDRPFDNGIRDVDIVL
jgi:phage-related holin